ncbi:carbohydrate kinase [uncultured Sunxiuqinia sp.]|uniref:carbohydrate kinase family protein n=1 Tax=uncultured Sunxiuqinia sp. TaxID=1573825 RepID=UPI0030DB58BA|tara:strand:+ start:1192 stop:2106 length:915 start_codon:yes stop_codon:yes gene_type:complete
MRKIVAAVGELLWDLLPGGKVLGGAPANFIYRMNSFGDMGQLITRIGDDDLGDEALERIRQLELSERNIQIDPAYPTGTVQVRLNKQGIPDYTIHEQVAYDNLEATPAALELARHVDCVCFGTLIQRTKQAREAVRQLLLAAKEATLFYDINLRKDCYTTEIIEESLHLTHILKINDEELIRLKELLKLESDTLKGLAGELILDYHLQMVLGTLGEKGAFVLSDTGEYHHDPGYRVTLADTVGSGDACSAGFIHQLLQGKSPEEALKFGNATGAKVATTIGGTQPVSKKEIEAFQREKHERIEK